MCSARANFSQKNFILFALVAQGPGFGQAYRKELGSVDKLDKLANKLGDMLVNELADRVLNAQTIHHATMDDTTLAKPGATHRVPRIKAPPHTRASSPGRGSGMKRCAEYQKMEKFRCLLGLPGPWKATYSPRRGGVHMPTMWKEGAMANTWESSNAFTNLPAVSPTSQSNLASQAVAYDAAIAEEEAETAASAAEAVPFVSPEAAALEAAYEADVAERESEVAALAAATVPALEPEVAAEQRAAALEASSAAEKARQAEAAAEAAFPTAFPAALAAAMAPAVEPQVAATDTAYEAEPSGEESEMAAYAAAYAAEEPAREAAYAAEVAAREAELAAIAAASEKPHRWQQEADLAASSAVAPMENAVSKTEIPGWTVYHFGQEASAVAEPEDRAQEAASEARKAGQETQMGALTRPLMTPEALMVAAYEAEQARQEAKMAASPVATTIPVAEPEVAAQDAAQVVKMPGQEAEVPASAPAIMPELATPEGGSLQTSEAAFDAAMPQPAMAQAVELQAPAGEPEVTAQEASSEASDTASEEASEGATLALPKPEVADHVLQSKLAAMAVPTVPPAKRDVAAYDSKMHQPDVELQQAAAKAAEPVKQTTELTKKHDKKGRQIAKSTHQSQTYMDRRRMTTKESLGRKEAANKKMREMQTLASKEASTTANVPAVEREAAPKEETAQAQEHKKTPAQRKADDEFDSILDEFKNKDTVVAVPAVAKLPAATAKVPGMQEQAAAYKAVEAEREAEAAKLRNLHSPSEQSIRRTSPTDKRHDYKKKIHGRTTAQKKYDNFDAVLEEFKKNQAEEGLKKKELAPIR